MVVDSKCFYGGFAAGKRTRIGERMGVSASFPSLLPTFFLSTGGSPTTNIEGYSN